MLPHTNFGLKFGPPGGGSDLILNFPSFVCGSIGFMREGWTLATIEPQSAVRPRADRAASLATITFNTLSLIHIALPHPHSLANLFPCALPFTSYRTARNLLIPPNARGTWIRRRRRNRCAHRSNLCRALPLLGRGPSTSYTTDRSPRVAPTPPQKRLFVATLCL